MNPKKHQLTMRRRYRMGAKSKPKEISRASNKTKKNTCTKKPHAEFVSLKNLQNGSNDPVNPKNNHSDKISSKNTETLENWNVIQYCDSSRIRHDVNRTRWLDPLTARYFFKGDKEHAQFSCRCILEIKHKSYTVIGDWWGKDRN